MMHDVVGLLISAAVGYWVIERADKHKGPVRRIGLLVGTLIVVASILSLACAVSCKTSGYYGWSSKRGGYCPMVGKGM